ncbi:MAG TPA: nitroreductase family protein [Chloroflexota bacterium]
MTEIMAGAGEVRLSVEQAIRGRRSVRRYLRDRVPDEDVWAVLDAARWAPSPHNSAPWRFVVLADHDTKARLAQAMGERWRADLSRDALAPEVIEDELRKSARRITGAPAAVVVCLTREGLDDYPDPARQQAELMMGAHSVGAAVQNMMLEAHGRGLATGWMCAPLFCPDVVVNALGLPADWTAQGLITLGYPAISPEAPSRGPLEDLVLTRTADSLPRL